MAFGYYFAHAGFTPDKYNEGIRQLEAAGAGAPAGRTYHVALESDGEIQVFDIWESKEQFEVFGETLVPILAGLGIEMSAPPMPSHVHNVIQG
jgi:hypothetical protein